MHEREGLTPEEFVVSKIYCTILLHLSSISLSYKNNLLIQICVSLDVHDPDVISQLKAPQSATDSFQNREK